MLVLTMGGISSRFKNAGYNVPKYLLKFGENLILTEIVKSYKRYIDNYGIIIIHNSSEVSSDLIDEVLAKCNINKYNYDVLSLDCLTAGQAQTARLGVQHFVVTGPISIVNADTLVKNWYGNYVEQSSYVDGVIDVTNWEGENWSFVVTDKQDTVIAIEEKHRISDLTCTGTYHFSSACDFVDVQKFIERDNLKGKDQTEFYVSRVYGQMLKSGAIFKSRFIDQSNIYLFGTPDEYKQTCNSNGYRYELPY